MVIVKQKVILMKTLGQKLKAARLEKNLTLQEVSKKAGLSVNYLSRIENDKVNITVGTLQKLAKCYQKDPGYFLNDSPSTGVRFIRRQERHSLGLDRGAELQVLLADDAQKLEVLLIDLEPGNESAPITSPGEKFIVVTKGVVTVVIEGEEYNLEEGDSLRFDSSNEHYWKNKTDQSASFLMIATPPRY
ncbi:helix-turn-helix domain-containing protein [Calderihabitans maritimus]|uniref:MerR family transcriptional regulator n=1 Tax=Calderihabitans maritimus TaxID=1246530 RepID=A0A1Z5HWV7_9FIRM|nr:XRE family transcriptional regulator [Calderihabitans maritimus]GAW93795.1 MerR family transcriptional regulator [Calderihabitans maritimus]